MSSYPVHPLLNTLPVVRPRKMASRKPALVAPADNQDPEMPDHDLEPPRFARCALERLLNNWPAVSAMLSTGQNISVSLVIHLLGFTFYIKQKSQFGDTVVVL